MYPVPGLSLQYNDASERCTLFLFQRTRKGFAYLFDVKFKLEEVYQLLSYLQDGHFIDDFTTLVRVRLLTYNSKQ